MSNYAEGPMEYNIGILTYSNRGDLLFRTLSRALDLCKGKVFVFFNGCDSDVENEIKKIFRDFNNIIYLKALTNLGSSGGYRELIKGIARQEPKLHVILLDDDNLLPRELNWALDSLVLKKNEIGILNRSGREILLDSKHSKKPWLLLGTTNSFLGRDIFSKIFLGVEETEGDVLAAPYGGLILPPLVLESMILPRKDYFLYADDYEYTYRLVRKFGFLIKLVEGAKIQDLEMSFHLGKSRMIFRNRYLEVDNSRLYYSVRNQTNFGLLRNKNRFLFYCNVVVVSFYFVVGFALRFKFDKVVTFVKAVVAGIRMK